MCNNVFKWFLRAFAVVAALTVISCADSPDEDDIVIPELSLSIDGTTIEEGNAAMMTFDETGGTKQFSIQTTGEWEITGLESAPQSFALTTSKGQEKYKGKGDETFTVTLGEATTASRFSMTVSVYASIFGQEKVADTQTITIVQTKGGELPVGKVIYNNNFDKEEATQKFGTSGSSWPFLDQFEGWKNHEGEGAAEVTYDFKSVSARANSKSDGSYSNYAGSGSNNLLFGGSGYLTIQNIAVSSTNLQLTFGTERYAYGESDNTFKNEEFLVTLSADGQSWSAPIAYSFEEGNDTNGKWNLATADFTLPDGTTKLYIKMATTLSGAHRVDDVKLTDGIGGQVITFEGGGDTPTPPTPGDAIYTNNFDKEAATKTYGTSGSSWPYIDQFEGWKNESGSGASAVTYEGSGVSVRANSESNGSYSNYAGSGANNIFFGTNGTLTIGNIALTSNKLCLTFGTERYLNGEDNTFKTEEFLVTLSADGKSWSKPITYAFEEGKDTNGKWNVATADFTLPESVKTLYINFASTIASAHRIDDVTLTSGNGGQEITFEGGDTPTPPTPGEAIYANNFDKEKATKTFGTNSSSWPYIDQFEGWKNESGSGASAVTYEGSGVSVRANSESNGSYSNYTGSGANNIFFGTNGTLTIGNIALTSNKLCLTFGTERYLNGEDNTFKNEEFLVTLSADGKSWSKPITYAFEEGKDTNGKWNVATADFTLPESVKTLYINFASTIASAHRIDDVTLSNGNGGQEIKFEGSGDEPTPSTPGTMTVAELVAKCKAAGSEQTVLDAANDVVVEAVVVTDKDGGNTNSKNLAIMAEGATAAGNGVLLYGSGITDPADESYTWKSGDKVKVTLKAGQARACIYNGTYEITGSAKADWIAIEKIGTATVTPVEITTVDKLAEYQSMVVKIKDATSPATAAEWCTADAYKTHTFTVGGSNLTVYVQKNAAAFVGKQFKASVKGDITGVVTVYKNNPQLAPRTADDVKAFNGEGGDEPTPSTPGTATVADLVAKCQAAGTTQTVLDADKDVVVEAVVVTDKDGGNTNAKNLAIMAEGATAAGNGVLLYGSGITDPTDPSYTWKSGDKVKVTLKAGQARACIYNGTYEITGSTGAEWIAIEKIGTATVTPVELTMVDKLAEYQSMVVKIKDATSPATAAEWCTADSYKTHTFTVGGSNLTVYVQKNAAAFVGKQYKALVKGDIMGVVTLYKSAPQLAPRTADDVKAFNGEGGGDQPDQPTPPTPGESGTITMSAADIIANGTTTITENSYGSQNVNDASTYYMWKMNDVTFAGARICKATASNYAGLIQMQGNASDKNKQGFFGNVDNLKKITKVVIVSRNTTYEPTEHLYVGTSAYPLGQNAVTRADLKQEGQTYTETFNVSGDYGYFAVANDKQGAFYVESVTVYYGGEGGDQPGGGDEPTPPAPSGKTAILTLEDIVAVIGSYNGQYNDTTITAADGSVWTGFVAGNNTRLQLGWNTTPTKSAAKSYLLVPNADKVIKKITFTLEAGTIDNRVLALLPVDFEYTGQSADEVKAAAYACSANTVKGSTEPISIDLTGKNLKRFMIRAVGGAVYLTGITIEYAE